MGTSVITSSLKLKFIKDEAYLGVYFSSRPCTKLKGLNCIQQHIWAFIDCLTDMEDRKISGNAQTFPDIWFVNYICM